MVRCKLVPTALAIVLLSSAGPLMANRYTIDTSPEKGGRVTVDGKFIGVAPVTLDIRLKNNEVSTITAEKQGAVSNWPVTVNYNVRTGGNSTINADKQGAESSWPQQIGRGFRGTIFVRLEADPAFGETEESDIANRWLTVEAHHAVDAQGQVDENLAWQKLVSIVTDRFADLEQVDRGSFYLRSTWEMRYFPFSVMRHRIVVKRGVGDALSVKVQIESQVFTRMDPRGKVDTDKFQPDPRIFRKDGETVAFIRDQL